MQLSVRRRIISVTLLDSPLSQTVDFDTPSDYFTFFTFFTPMRA